VYRFIPGRNIRPGCDATPTQKTERHVVDNMQWFSPTRYDCARSYQRKDLPLWKEWSDGIKRYFTSGDVNEEESPIKFLEWITQTPDVITNISQDDDYFDHLVKSESILINPCVVKMVIWMMI
jgi:hypothetical protein